MTTQLLELQQSKSLSFNVSARQKVLFLKGFWIFTAISFFIIMTAKVDFLSILAALIIAIAALLPSYLWCRDRAKGLPLFPLLAINYLFTHAFPLITNNKAVQEYSSQEHFISSLIVVCFLAIATFTWLFYVQKTQVNLTRFKEFDQKQVFPFFISILILGIVYQVAANSGWLWFILPSSIISGLRVITGGLNSLAVIVLGYSLGSKTISKSQSYFFLVIMAILLFTTGVSLYLNIPGFYLLFASMGWMVGSKKIPWRLLLTALLIIGFLNYGKGITRGRYWNMGDSGIQASEYVQVYQSWINNSLQVLKKPNSDLFGDDAINYSQDSSLINRSSVIHMLLKVQSETGIQRPYLWGKTYRIIPQLLVPRILNPEKIRGGEANHILSVHYGLQTYNQTLKTSIGWGLLQEAYANFSFLGCIGLGIVLGNLYGWITYWSMNTSSLSFRFLVALIFMTLAFKTEITMGIFISVVFQSLILLSAIRILFMKTTSNNLKMSFK